MDKNIFTGNSKNVETPQKGIHEKLEEIVIRHKKTEYKRPISHFTQEKYQEIEDKIFGRELIIDAGCGVGMSSYQIALENPNQLVLGIDRSDDRLERKNYFKKSLPPNLIFMRGKLDEWWPLLFSLHQAKKLKVIKNYILYPNPYPKPKSLKLRWHAHPVFRLLMEFNAPIELRSNFKLYLEEFLFAANLYGKEGTLGVLNVAEPLTAFEKKYANSGQELYVLKID